MLVPGVVQTIAHHKLREYQELKEAYQTLAGEWVLGVYSCT